MFIGAKPKMIITKYAYNLTKYNSQIYTLLIEFNFS